MVTCVRQIAHLVNNQGSCWAKEEEEKKKGRWEDWIRGWVVGWLVGWVGLQVWTKRWTSDNNKHSLMMNERGGFFGREKFGFTLLSRLQTSPRSPPLEGGAASDRLHLPHFTPFIPPPPPPHPHTPNSSTFPLLREARLASTWENVVTLSCLINQYSLCNKSLFCTLFIQGGGGGIRGGQSCQRGKKTNI